MIKHPYTQRKRARWAVVLRHIACPGNTTIMQDCITAISRSLLSARMGKRATAALSLSLCCSRSYCALYMPYIKSPTCFFSSSLLFQPSLQYGPVATATRSTPLLLFFRFGCSLSFRRRLQFTQHNHVSHVTIHDLSLQKNGKKTSEETVYERQGEVVRYQSVSRHRSDQRRHHSFCRMKEKGRNGIYVIGNIFCGQQKWLNIMSRPPKGGVVEPQTSIGQLCRLFVPHFFIVILIDSNRNVCSTKIRDRLHCVTTRTQISSAFPYRPFEKMTAVALLDIYRIHKL